MKVWHYAVLAWAALLQPCAAQVDVELLVGQEQYLPHESLQVGVRISNLSGRTLEFGTNTDWVHFTVNGPDGEVVDQRTDVPRAPAFNLPSSRRITKVFDLAPHFNCTAPGRYRVSAVLKIEGYDQAIYSAPRTFDIVTGTRVWEQVFGLPPKVQVPGQPTARKYILLKAVSTKDMRLYVRLTDPDESHSLKIYQLSPLVSFSMPEAQCDRDGNLHVLCQVGARAFLYQVLSWDCELVRRMTYEYFGTRPTLISDGEGSFRVTGGRRLPTPDDVSPTSDKPVVRIITPSASTNAPAKKKKKKREE